LGAFSEPLTLAELLALGADLLRVEEVAGLGRLEELGVDVSCWSSKGFQGQGIFSTFGRTGKEGDGLS